jgi:lipoyl(octanoyl) transferase
LQHFFSLCWALLHRIRSTYVFFTINHSFNWCTSREPHAKVHQADFAQIWYTDGLMPEKTFPPRIIQRGLEPYPVTFDAMRVYTDQRNAGSEDQLWIVEHPPVYTLGLAGDTSHILNAHQIPVVQTDRGGEVTYHGPGQAVIYLLLDLKRQRRQGLVREFVQKIEQAVINTLAAHGIRSERKPGAPGIYLSDAPDQGAKIAALGLKIRASGCTYHGVSLNVAMDLTPFSYINPCGYADLRCIDMRGAGVVAELPDVQNQLAHQLQELLS